MIQATERLHPRPQKAVVRDGLFNLPSEVAVRLQGDISSVDIVGDRLITVLDRIGSNATITIGSHSHKAHIEISIDSASQNRSQGYSLDIDSTGIRIVAADIPGAIFAVTTLGQYLTAHLLSPDTLLAPLRCVHIKDWPDFPIRGVLLDISRDRVPSRETLIDLIERLASWKINQLQLYTEHTFAYVGHEIVWQDASPLTCDDIRDLDVICQRHCIELVPNQNSFGHFHRWLVHEPYRHLAECPEGIKHPFHEDPQPFSLCPIDPRVLDLLADLYDQLLPCFASSLFNVGLDETFDLGEGRSAAACEDKGKLHVYLDYLNAVHDLVDKRGHRMQFWADTLLQRPDLAYRLPTGVTALEWGYEADHPFLKHSQILAETGLEFYVCPGTSSWNSLAGRTNNSIRNLANAATAGQQAGARGFLITDWGDFGHMQPLTVSLPGFLIGAGFAWNSSTAADPGESRTLAPSLLDEYAFDFKNAGLAEIVLELGDIYRITGSEIKNGSVLFFILIFASEPLTHKRFAHLNLEGLEKAQQRIEELQRQLDKVPNGARSLELSKRETNWAAAVLRFSCQLGIERLKIGRQLGIGEIPENARQQLCRDLRPLIEEYRYLWTQRSRPGGLVDSQNRLNRLLDLLQ